LVAVDCPNPNPNPMNGRGKSREYGDACNARVRRDLKMRKLFSVNKERKLNPISFNGEEVRTLSWRIWPKRTAS
jgi:hypothetical protein